MIVVEEQTLVKSDQYNAKKILIAFFIIGAIVALILFSYYVSVEWSGNWTERYVTYESHQAWGTCGKLYSDGKLCSDCRFVKEHPSKLLYAMSRLLLAMSEALYWNKYEILIPAVSVIVLGIVVYLWLRSYELTVTNKRVFGRAAWGKRVDLPVDSVSAISTVNLLKGISVSTPSGRISFLLVKNVDEIYKVINELLITRQKEEVTTTASSVTDELKKYKELLDSGVISQEEFDTKKRQLLGL